MNTGQAAEARAEAHLINQGLRLLTRNYRCRRGEIDLILRDGDTTVMVEVRQRSRVTHGSAAESVVVRKQRRIISAARHYLATQPGGAEAAVRFDVVCIDGEQPIDWIRSAFEANEY